MKRFGTDPERPKSGQERLETDQERAKSAQEQLKSGQERPKSDQERPKSGPKAILEASWLVLGPFWRAKWFFIIF